MKHEDFHQMLSKDANILIIDHNTLRFHTYDLLMCVLLSQKGIAFSKLLTNDIKDILNCADAYSKAFFLKEHLKSYDISSMFSCHSPDEKYPTRYMDLLDNFLDCESKDEPKNRHITVTDLYGRLSAVFEKPDVRVKVLRSANETYNTSLPKKTEYYTVSTIQKLFDVDALMRFITTHSINCIILDNVDVAACLSIKLKETCFIFGEYRYNYPENMTPKHGIYNSMDMLLYGERENKNDFGIFNPYPSNSI